ncbi:MAG: phage tail tape measure protein [Acidobacteriota bacterium]|nr:phage tail tape measure protein [Acidobacteriota bacterium]
MAVNLKITGDGADFENELTKLQAKVVQLESKLRDSASASKRRSKETKQDTEGLAGSFDKVGASIAKWMVGLTSVGGALSTIKGYVTKLLDAVEQARTAAKEGLADPALKEFAALAQLSKGDPAVHQRLIAQTKELYMAGGAGTLAEAAKTTFQLESAGAGDEENRKMFADLYGIMGEDLGGLAASLTTLYTGMGKEETGTLRQILSKALVASEINPQDVPELVEASVSAIPYGKEMGWSDEEILAAIGTFARVIGSANEAGTALAAFGKALTREGMFQGLTAPEQVKKLADMKLSEQQLLGMLGPEAIQALAYGLTQARDEKGDEMFEGLTLMEALEKLASKGLSEKQLAETLGPAVVDALTRATGQYQSFAGLGIKGATEKLSGLGLTAPQMIEFLGRQEAYLGYSTMMGVKDTSYADVLAKVQAAQEQDLVGQVIESAKLQPEIVAMKARQKAQAALEIARIPFGAEEAIVDVIRARKLTEEAQKGKLGMSEHAVDALIEKQLRYGGPEHVVATFGTEEEKRMFYGVRESMRAGGLYAPGTIPTPPDLDTSIMFGGAPGPLKGDPEPFRELLRMLGLIEQNTRPEKTPPASVFWDTLLPPPGPVPMTTPTVDRSS